jgi:hypothetical protein
VGSIRRGLVVGITWTILLLVTTSRPASAQTLESISLNPQEPVIQAGFWRTFTATAHYSNGTTANVTQTATWTSSNTGVAIVTNQPGLKGLVTAVAQGTARITASMTVGTVTIRGSSTVTVADGDLVSITTKPTTKNLEVGQQSPFKATALYIDESTDDVTNDVVWSSTDPQVASVSNAAGSKGVVTAHKVGTVTIVALDQESGVKNTDGLTNVRAQVSHLSFDPPDVMIGKGIKFPLRVYANRVDGTRSQITEDVTYSVFPAGVVSIGTGDDAGIVTPLKNGAVTIVAVDPKRQLSTATSGNNGRVAVRGKLKDLVVESNPIRMVVGEEKNARAIGILSSGKRTSDLRRIVQWSVANPAIATVGNTVNDVGEVVAKQSGTTTLRATYGKFTSAQVDNVQVLGALQSVELEAGDGLIPLNEEVEFKARGKYEGDIELNISDRCEWSVVNTVRAEVDNADSGVDGDGKGWVKGKALGDTVVKVDCNGKKAQAGIEVIGTLIGLEVEPNPYDAVALEEKQFRAWGQYDSGGPKDLTKLSTWTSSNTAVASIDNELDPGTAVAIGTGATTIEAKYRTFTATSQLTVGAGIVSMFIVPETVTVRGSEYKKLKARGRKADNDVIDVSKRAVWTSSNEDVARVSNRPNEQGLAFGGGTEGTAQITASLPGTPFVATASLTTSCLLTSLRLERQPVPLQVGRIGRIKAVGTFCNGSTKKITESVAFTSSNPNVLLVSNEPKAYGVLSAVSPGSAVITAIDVSSGIAAGNPITVTVVP